MYKNILVAEDEPVVRNMYNEVLNMFGYNPILTENGLQAYNQYKSQNIDLVLTDIVMPEMDGLSLIKKIREEDQNIPILVASGEIGNDKIFQLQNLNVNEILRKPIRMSKLLERINSYLHVEMDIPFC